MPAADHRSHLPIRKAVAATCIRPTPSAPARPTHTRLGLTIGPGFNKRAAEAIGTVFGCTHLTEMLRAMGTVAFQSMWPILARREKEQAQAEAKAKSAESRRRSGIAATSDQVC